MQFSILGCGWLGLPFAKKMVYKNFTVRGTTTSAEKIETLKKKKIDGILLKIADNKIEGNLEKLLKSDLLLIAVPFGQQKENLAAYRILVKKIENSTIKKVVFISSTSVYADTNKTVTETADFKINPAKKKLIELENIFLENKNFNTVIVRFAGLIGGNRNPGNFFKNKTEVPNGLAPINLIHLDDCLEILEKICLSDFKNEIFNAATDTHPTRKDFYTQAILNNNRIPPIFLENDDYSFKIISNNKLKEKLDYTFIHKDLMQLKF